jgi:hypothetical protein
MFWTITSRSVLYVLVHSGEAFFDPREHFFSQRVVEGWNETPADLKQAVNVKTFKNGYRTYREKMVERT